MTVLISVGRGITSIFDKTEYEPHTVELNSANYLNINLATSDLTITNGNKLEAKTDSDSVSINVKDKKVIIKETEKWYKFKKAPKVTVTIPNDLKFDDVYIETGAGKLNIKELSVKNLSLKLGAGKIEIDNIMSDKTTIENGAGSLKIANGILGNAKIAGGVGSMDITAKITGDSKIETGIGSINLDLINVDGDYTLDIEKGLGSITYNGDKIKDDKKIGNGSNFIKLEGGIGSIKVTKKSR